MVSASPLGRGNFKGKKGWPIVKYSNSAVSCAKTAEPFEMSFDIWTRGGPKEALLGGGAYYHHLATTVEPCMCSADVACCQITLTTCY